VLNHVRLIGHLSRPPEAGEERRLGPVAYVRLITNYRGGPGIEHRVVVRGKRGATVLERLTTGDRIHIQGRLRYRTLHDEEGRPYRQAEIVTLGDVLFLTPPQRSGRDNEPERELPPKVSDEELGIPPGEGNHDPEDTLEGWKL
jgi:single-stranded DNA-binding protein